jgi:hypothetical protein
VFNLYGNERLTQWKTIRDNLETEPQPLETVAALWAQAPFVSPYLNPKDSTSWPDPWHLILDGKMDNLAITLGMLYTIKLTQRFMTTLCEIHMSMPTGKKESEFYLVVDNRFVLNYEYGKVVDVDVLNRESEIIWSGTSLQ